MTLDALVQITLVGGGIILRTARARGVGVEAYTDYTAQIDAIIAAWLVGSAILAAVIVDPARFLG